MSNASINVQTKAIPVPMTVLLQKLNSPSFLMNGLYSSDSLIGSTGLSKSSSSISELMGVKNPKNKLSTKIAKQYETT